MTNILISLGSNKWGGKFSPAEIVMLAAKSLLALGRGQKMSSLYRSDAWPDPTAPAYVNAVLQMQCSIAPHEVLGALLAIEAGFSRLRSDDPVQRYAPRTLDLDLLDYGGIQMEADNLSLPHPRMEGRAFIMAPLVEIIPEWQHPVSHEGAQAIHSRCNMAGVARLPFTGGAPSG